MKTFFPVAIVLLLVVFNCEWLLSEEGIHPFAFYLPAIVDGEWWRVVTSVFAHFSWYHLVFDALVTLAFLFLVPWKDRPWVFLVAGVGSIALPFLMVPDLRHLALGGLSGITYGLALAACWHMAIDSKSRADLLIGLVGGLLVVSVSFAEVFFEFQWLSRLHPAQLGNISTESHLGGVLGTLFLLTARSTLPRVLTIQPVAPSH